MKLDYFTLLSPEPITISGVCSIKSPTLREISKLGNGLQAYYIYQSYLSALLMDIDSYYETINKHGDMYFANYSNEDKELILSIKKEYESLPTEEKVKLGFYDILMYDKNLIHTVCESLDFFLVDKVEYISDGHLFLTYNSDSDNPTGYINSATYSGVVDLILQRVNIQNKKSEYENTKVKNSIAAKLLEKMKKATEANKKKADKKLELPNIISSLSTHSKTLNILNIWDLTVFQLYDQFTRQRFDDSYSIQSASVSAWGDSDGKFDETIWYSNINDN